MPTTFEEMRFLDHLGMWSRHATKPQGINLSRTTLLLMYRETMHLRDDWGKIDPAQISYHIAVLLKLDSTSVDEDEEENEDAGI